MKLKRHINFLNENYPKGTLTSADGTENLIYVEDQDVYDTIGNIKLSEKYVTNGKLNIKFFNNLTDNNKFEIDGIGLTTLEGIPSNELNTLICNNNELKDLKGSPIRIRSWFDASSNPLTSLEGSPDYCEEFYVQFCNELTDLKGAPKHIVNMFDASFCENLTSLEGIPDKMEHLDLKGCKKLSNLEYLPTHINGSLSLSGTNVSNLIGLLDSNIGEVEYSGSKVTKIEYDFYIDNFSFINKNNYYSKFIEYIKENINNYDPKAYNGIVFHPDVYRSFDDKTKNFFKSIKITSKYNL